MNDKAIVTQGVTDDGRAYIQDEDFTYDARLYVDGDFPSEQARDDYVNRILTTLRQHDQGERDKALEEALTPSGSTKYAYSGEFKFSETVGFDDDGHEINQEITVPWTTIKEIMAAIKDRALKGATQ